MICPRCGTDNTAEARYCIRCGEALAAAPVTATTTAPPPLSLPTPPAAGQTLVYAGFWRRFVAFIIDYLILSIPTGFISMLLGLSMFPFFGMSSAASDRMAELAVGAAMMGFFWSSLMSVLVTWIYYAALESSKFQATPGKMVLGLYVTDLEGKPISFARASGRYFGKFISSIILMIGFIMAGFTERKQALHDILADTLVVKR